MSNNEVGQFFISVLVFTVIGFMLAMLLSPPDPFTQIIALITLLPVILAASYILTYRIGYRWT